MTEVKMEKERSEATPAVPEEFDAVDEQLAEQLTDRARSQGLELTGEGGQLARLTKRVVGSGQHNSNTDDHHVLAAMPSNSLAGVPGAEVLVEGRTGREHSLALTVHPWYRMVVLTEAGSGTNNQQPTAQAVCKIRATAGNPDVLGDQDTTLRRVP